MHACVICHSASTRYINLTCVFANLNVLLTSISVDLRSVGYPEQPLLVDTTPPLEGDVFDGNVRGVNWEYQKESDMYCANWRDFVDPESGISMQCVTF